MRIKASVPDIALRHNNIGPLPLHDHGVDEILIWFLLLNQLFDQDLIDPIDPMLHLLLIIGLGRKLSLYCLLDYLFDFIIGEHNFIHLLA